MSEPTLDDLRVWQVNEANVAGGSGWWRELTPAEFDRIATERGYVARPVCGECDKGRKVTWSGDRIVCPSCGGSGFGRLVALDGIDVEALDDALGDVSGGLHLSGDQMDLLLLTARRVLAAIDQEAT